ncbi:helix-turn-helix domain-containing protein (plasmid) [Pigmentibacter ruber]
MSLSAKKSSKVETISNLDKKLKNGGRSLLAVWKNEHLSSSQKLILLCFTSHLNFNSDFKEWFKISVNQISQETSFSVRTVQKILKELVEQGYIYKMRNYSSKTYLQEENSYCLSDKIFDEYLEYLKRTRIALHDAHVQIFLQYETNNSRPCISLAPTTHQDQTAPAPAADILPCDLSLNVSLYKSMCVEKKSHTKNEHKKSKSLKQASIVVCELLKHKLNMRFIPNHECEDIISNAMTKLKIDDIKIVLNFAKQAMTNDDYKELNNYINIESIFIKELQNYINNEEYISGYMAASETQSVVKNENKVEKKEIIKTELSKEKPQAPIEEYPEPFKSWFKTLNETTKNNIRKEIKLHGRAKFFNLILPSVRAYKVFIEQLSLERRAA